MPQDRHPSSSSQDWLARAKGDLALALAPLPEGAFYEDLCFHAQQAAEKAVKAVYQSTNWHFGTPMTSENSFPGSKSRVLPSLRMSNMLKS